jgi:hypothetical protein
MASWVLFDGDVMKNGRNAMSDKPIGPGGTPHDLYNCCCELDKQLAAMTRERDSLLAAIAHKAKMEAELARERDEARECLKQTLGNALGWCNRHSTSFDSDYKRWRKAAGLGATNGGTSDEN